jgi:hypothetical protein
MRGAKRVCLVNPRVAKLMIGMVNKSAKLDAKGMNRLVDSPVVETNFNHNCGL